MIRCQRVGSHTVVLVEDLSQVSLEEIKQKYNATITIEQLSLEDIFVEVHA